MLIKNRKAGDDKRLLFIVAGTGALDDVGSGRGHNYSINVPLQEGVDDESYRIVFEPILAKVQSPPRSRLLHLWLRTN